MLGSELMKEFTIDIVARMQEFSFFRATRQYHGNTDADCSGWLIF